jgi:hypothetical protein
MVEMVIRPCRFKGELKYFLRPDDEKQYSARAKTYGGISLARERLAKSSHAQFGELPIASFRESMTKRATGDES